DGVGGLAGGVEGVQAGDDEAREQAHGGGRQLGGGEKRLGVGQGVGGNHRGARFLRWVLLATGGVITRPRRRQTAPFSPLHHSTSVQRNFIERKRGALASPRLRFGLPAAGRPHRFFTHAAMSSITSPATCPARRYSSGFDLPLPSWKR